MGWREQIRPASFRGVPFKVATDERGGGRRTVDHEYPQQDEAYVEDLGRRYRTFRVEGHVLGDDYAIQRDALLTALEAEGVGQLVHPFFGTRTVQVDTFTCRQTLTEEGRIARFAITFKESLAAPIYPVAAVDRAEDLRTSADGALTSVKSSFERFFSTDGMPQFVLDSGAGILKDAAGAMNTFLGPVVAATTAAADLKHQVDNLILDADALVRSPFKIFGQLKGVLDTFTTAPALPSRKVSSLLKAYGLNTSPAPAQTTSTRQQEATNRTALIGVVQQMSLIEAVRQAPDVEFDSYEAAVATRDLLLAKLDEQTDATTDDDVFTALSALRAKLVLAVPDSTRELARLQVYTPAIAQPSLVLAYDLYGHLRFDDDLVQRNRVRYPGFVPGGKALQVLTDG